MELAQDRVQWWAFVLAVLNLGFCCHGVRLATTTSVIQSRISHDVEKRVMIGLNVPIRHFTRLTEK
jgi:hypothetical protein